MRFSYIDSQGREIEVDSVESLALRVELGAVKPETRLYDAVADRWAPAEDHPVYRSLVRGEEVREEDILPPDPPDSPEASKAREAPDSPEAPGAEGIGGEEDVPDSTEEAPDPSPSESDPLGLDFTVTPVDEGALDQEDGEAPEDEGIPRDEKIPQDEGIVLEDGTLEDEEVLQEEEPPEDEGILEEEALEHRRPAWLDVDDPWGDGEEIGKEIEEAPSGEADGEDLQDFRDGRGPTGETEVEEAGVEPPGGGGEETYDEVEEGGAWEDEEAERKRGREAAEAPASAPAPMEAPGEPQREAVRPPHWDERKRAAERKRRLLKGAGAAAVLGLVGVVGGALLLGNGDEPTAAAGAGEREVQAEPMVPPDLEAPLRRVEEEALRTLQAGLADEVRARELPPTPPSAWLRGIYLAQASLFPQVFEYWEEVSEVAAEIPGREEALFREGMDSALASLRREEDGPAMEMEIRLLDAALYRFRERAPARRAAYAEVEGVARSALELHELLVRREEDIMYDPFRSPGVSRDPVLEAVPADEELSRELNRRIDQVLRALERSGIRRPVSTEGILLRLQEGVEFSDSASGEEDPF